jgi:hypothetical protein
MSARTLASICYILAATLGAAAFLYLGVEYHFGSGYGLIGWVSFPATIACLWMVVAGFMTFYAEVVAQEIT